jgi:hypothetical protein
MKLYRSLPAGEECRVPGKQLLRYCRGRRLPGRLPSAVQRRVRLEIGVVLEEVDETAFWLELLLEGRLMSEDKLRNLLQEANGHSSILVASLRTAKGISS